MSNNPILRAHTNPQISPLEPILLFFLQERYDRWISRKMKGPMTSLKKII